MLWSEERLGSELFAMETGEKTESGVLENSGISDANFCMESAPIKRLEIRLFLF